MSLPSGPIWAGVIGFAVLLILDRIDALREWWKDMRLKRQIRARQKREPWSEEPAKRYRDARAKGDRC